MEILNHLQVASTEKDETTGLVRLFFEDEEHRIDAMAWIKTALEDKAGALEDLKAAATTTSTTRTTHTTTEYSSAGGEYYTTAAEVPTGDMVVMDIPRGVTADITLSCDSCDDADYVVLRATATGGTCETQGTNVLSYTAPDVFLGEVVVEYVAINQTTKEETDGKIIVHVVNEE